MLQTEEAREQWRVAKIRARKWLEKYWDESRHPRDEDGKFTDAGGVAFISPNVEDLKFEDALEELDSRRQYALRHASYDVDRQLGKSPVEAGNVVGAWADGAENSLAMVMPKGWSLEQIKVATAMKGWLGDQKSALIFAPDVAGNSYLATIALPGDLAAMHQQLLDGGLAFHTLEPTDGGALVHVWGDDQATMDAVDALAEKYDVKAQFTIGNGEFIGTTKQEGSDREQRDDARSAYEAIIAAPEAGAAFEGRDLGKIWDDIRSRWGGELSPKEVDEHGRLAGGGAPIDVASLEAKTKLNVALAAATLSQEPLPGNKGVHPATIASRNPTAVKSVAPKGVYGQPDVASMKLEPKRYADDISKFANGDFYPNFRKDDFKGGPDAAVSNIVTQMKDNLKFLYQFADKNTQVWYDGARALVDDRVKLYGFNDASVAAVYAALSPTKDWDQNVHIADMLLKTYSERQDFQWDDKMAATAKEIWSAKNQAIVKLVAGKTLGELSDPEEKAVWIRTYDEAHNSSDYRQVLPDGSLGDLQRTKDGTPAKVVWQSLASISNAVKALEADGDREVISAAMGSAHKVRSFYNNILDPHSANGDVTIDTHAVGAALLRQLPGSAVPVAHNFGNTPMKVDQPEGWEAVGSSTKTGLSGLYPVYAQAYREAASELGIQPRQLQSAVWVVKRDTFGNAPKKTQDAIETAWHNYHSDKGVTLEATRTEIATLLGLEKYGRRYYQADREGWSSGDARDLHRSQLGQSAAGVDGRAGDGAARRAAGLDAVQGRERRAGTEVVERSSAHSDWMNECVPTLMGYGKDQIVAVAACLNMWRQAWEESHPDGADDPGPSPKEASEDSPLNEMRAWNESEHPRGETGPGTNPGSFAPSAGGTTESSSEAKKPPKSKKPATKADFDKAKVRIRHTESEQAAFIAAWNEKIGIDPEEFEKTFTGGLQDQVELSVGKSGSEFQVTGIIKDKDGKTIGNFDRDLKPDKKEAYSAFFKLNKENTGGGIGKKILGGNIAAYEAMGIETVKVTANIDKGGYAWAKYGYVPTPAAWSTLSADLERKLDRETQGEGGGSSRSSSSDNTYEADSWDLLSSDQQEETERRWMRDTRDEFLQSEIDSWRDNGEGLEIAKRNLQEAFNNEENDWALEGLKELEDERKEEGGKPYPFNNEQILAALSMEDYETGNHDGRDDPEFIWDDESLNAAGAIKYAGQLELPGIEPPEYNKLLTAEMRTEIEARLTRKFNGIAEQDQHDVDPPDWLAESVDEYQGEYWSQKDDSEKLQHAIDYGQANIPIEDEEEQDDEQSTLDLTEQEKQDPEIAELYDLVRGSNPKNLWKIADSSYGKKLLLGSGWSGVLSLTDKEAMARFKDYVGKTKK